MVVANTGRIWTFDQGECQYGDGWASIIRDDLHCTYQAMGYDSTRVPATYRNRWPLVSNQVCPGDRVWL